MKHFMKDITGKIWQHNIFLYAREYSFVGKKYDEYLSENSGSLNYPNNMLWGWGGIQILVRDYFRLAETLIYICILVHVVEVTSTLC